MYTQCPDCEIAFKVTADVLKQAAGKVRCGSCGNAFNALSYLSEQMPKQPVVKEANADVPELRPEIIETDSGPPHSISAEQSAALLKTLDELAGSDIRIEDTGVEWRVLDEQEAAAPAADDDDAGHDTSANFNTDLNTVNVDEFLDDAETPIDEFLTATPEIVDSPEIFDEDANGPAKTPVDELRFDDNTPLPDDFDLDDESSYVAVSESVIDPVDEDDVPDPVIEELQPEIALSEPDEWQDILGEFEDLVDGFTAPVEGLDSEIDSEDVIDEERPADLVAVDESGSDKPLDMDTQFALQAEAMGIDLSGINEFEIDEDDIVEETEGSQDETIADDLDAELDDEPIGEELEEELADEFET